MNKPTTHQLLREKLKITRGRFEASHDELLKAQECTDCTDDQMAAALTECGDAGAAYTAAGLALTLQIQTTGGSHG